jgi:hypothetical protein
LAAVFEGALLRLITRRDDEPILGFARRDLVCRRCSRRIFGRRFLSSSNHASAIFMSP